MKKDKLEIKKLKQRLRQVEKELKDCHIHIVMQGLMLEAHTVMFGDLKDILEYHGLWPTRKRTKLEAQRKMRKQDILRMKPHSRAVN